MTPGEVAAEVKSILAARDAQRAAKVAEGKAYALRSMEHRLEAFKRGGLGMCSCVPCLTGYVLRSPDLLCREGQRQFWRDTWQPYVM
jgi:hypothetical protein